MNAQTQLENLVATFTIEDLAAKSGRTVAEIVGFALEGAPSRARRGTETIVHKAPSARTGTTGPRGVDTRTVTGRRQYEADMLSALQQTGRWTSAAELRQMVGGTPMQARAVLNRLIDDGRVVYEGQARATKYRAA